MQRESSGGILLAAERVASACSHVVLCNSDSLRNEALALGLAPESKLRLLGSGSSNGVDVERFQPGPGSLRAGLGLPLHALVVGFVGRLTRDKGLPELVEAFDAILAAKTEAHLLLVGWFDAAEDALEEALRARIRSHPRIHMTGFVADTAPYYRVMDVMVLPTWREGFPERRSGGRSHRDSRGDNLVHRLPRRRGAGGDRTADSSRLSGSHQRGCAAIAAQPETPLPHGHGRSRLGDRALCQGRVLGLTVDYYKSLLERNPRANSRVIRVSADSALYPI